MRTLCISGRNVEVWSERPFMDVASHAERKYRACITLLLTDCRLHVDKETGDFEDHLVNRSFRLRINASAPVRRVLVGGRVVEAGQRPLPATAPIWAAFMKKTLAERFGGGEAGERAAAHILEVLYELAPGTLNCGDKSGSVKPSQTKCSQAPNPRTA